MRSLIDREVLYEFLEAAEKALKNQFNYSDEELEGFVSKFLQEVNAEHADLLLNGSQTFKVVMWTDYESRHIFTCNFAGLHLMRTLEKYNHFSFQELMLFEELLSKYIQEVVELIEPPKKFERTNDRKPFTAL